MFIFSTMLIFYSGHVHLASTKCMSTIHIYHMFLCFHLCIVTPFSLPIFVIGVNDGDGVIDDVICMIDNVEDCMSNNV